MQVNIDLDAQCDVKRVVRFALKDQHHCLTGVRPVRTHSAVEHQILK
jgi:hypothetical protein